jgi:hypothetical protein
LRKHVNSNHCNIFRFFEKQVNYRLKENERQPSKKRPNISSNSISSFFATKEPFKKDEVQQKQFFKDLGLLIIKNHLPLQFVENSWLKRFSMHLCPNFDFLSIKFFSYELLLQLMEKTRQLYVLLALEKCHYATTSFDLWMSKDGHDIFALVINLLGVDW